MKDIQFPFYHFSDLVCLLLSLFSFLHNFVLQCCQFLPGFSQDGIDGSILTWVEFLNLLEGIEYSFVCHFNQFFRSVLHSLLLDLYSFEDFVFKWFQLFSLVVLEYYLVLSLVDYQCFQLLRMLLQTLHRRCATLMLVYSIDKLYDIWFSNSVILSFMWSCLCSFYLSMEYWMLDHFSFRVLILR